jgi:multiple sugar transport system substrate-binding protein
MNPPVYSRRHFLRFGAAATATLAMPFAARAQNKIELLMLDYITGPNGDILSKFVSDFMAANPDVSIKRQTVPQNVYQNSLLQRAAAGQPADLLCIDGPMTPGLVEAELLTPIDKYIDLDVDKIYYPGPLSTGRWKGKLYGLPIGNNAEVLLYNKKMLQNSGAAVPTTQEELKTVGAKLKGNGVYGFSASAYSGEECTWDWLPYLWGRGGNLDDLHSQAAVEALAFWGDLVKDGIAPAAQTSWQTSEIEPRFVNGQLAMAMIGSWQIRTLQANAKKGNVDFGLTVLPSAMKSGEKPIIPFGGEVMAVGSATPEKTAAAWRFIKWLTSPEIITSLDEKWGYVPSSLPATAIFAKNPDNQPLSAVSEQLPTSRSRTELLGPRYYEVSAKITTAIQQVMTGAADAKTALAAI